MPRMQVYLPENLYGIVKDSKLSASELLQDAVRAEVRRRELLSATQTYITELAAEVGEPTPEEIAEARELVSKVARRARKKAV